MTSASYDVFVRKAQNATTEAEKHAAFDALHLLFHEKAERWARTQLDDAHLAQDAAQDAWISAYEHIDQLREADAFPAWLRRIVISQAHRQIRRKITQQTRGAFDEDVIYADAQDITPNDPAQVIEVRELARDVRHALDELPDHERSVTELYYLTGYSQQEIAEQLALPLTTVKKRLQYARERLRKTMSPQFSAILHHAEGHDVWEWVFMLTMPHFMVMA